MSHETDTTPPSSHVTFAGLLAHHLEQQGHSVTWLAEQAEVDLPVAQQWLAGTAYPMPLEFSRIANSLHLPDEARLRLVEAAGFQAERATDNAIRHLTHIGIAYGPVVSGSGTISIYASPPSTPGPSYFLAGLQRLLEWETRNEYERSSLVGLALFLLRVTTQKITRAGMRQFLYVLGLWTASIVCMWPLLQWPLNRAEFLMALAWVALGSYSVPALVAVILPPPAIPAAHSARGWRVWWYIRFEGAMLGWYVFALLTFLIVLLAHYAHLLLNFPPLPFGSLLLLPSLPLLFAYASGGQAQHREVKHYSGEGPPEINQEFLLTLLILPVAIGAAIYQLHPLLLQPLIALPTFVFILLAINLFEEHRAHPSPTSERLLILTFGVFSPLLLLLGVLILMPAERPTSSAEFMLLLVGIEILIGMVCLLLTLGLRGNLNLTWRSVPLTMLWVGLLMGSALLSPWLMLALFLLTLLLRALPPGHRWQPYVMAHETAWLMLANLILVILLDHYQLLPLPAIALLELVIIGLLLRWAWHKPAPPPHEENPQPDV